MLSLTYKYENPIDIALIFYLSGLLRPKMYDNIHASEVMVKQVFSYLFKKKITKWHYLPKLVFFF